MQWLLTVTIELVNGAIAIDHLICLFNLAPHGVFLAVLSGFSRSSPVPTVTLERLARSSVVTKAVETFPPWVDRLSCSLPDAPEMIQEKTIGKTVNGMPLHFRSSQSGSFAS